MAVPALIYVAVNASAGDGALAGWAVPTATDIAFAHAVLGVISTHLPATLRTSLLTLAVVDDLIAILIIALFYSSSLHLIPLGLAVIPCAVRGAGATAGAVTVAAAALAAATWALVHAGGTRAAVAGILLAFSVPVNRRAEGPGPGLAEHFEHRFSAQEVAGRGWCPSIVDAGLPVLIPRISVSRLKAGLRSAWCRALGGRPAQEDSAASVRMRRCLLAIG